MKQQRNNLDNVDKLLYEYFEKNKDIPQETAKVISRAPYKRKIKYNISKVAVLILTLSILTTGVVFAKEITNFFRNLFGLDSIGINNDSIVNAIENKDYIQNVDMNYIKLNDKFSIKVDYLMVDDINLYAVFNVYSEEYINPNYRISIPDLKIIGNDDIIYDASSGMNYSIYTTTGWHKITQEEKESKRELLFLMSDGLPNMKKLQFQFSKVILYDDTSAYKEQIEINCNEEKSINIDIIDKFTDRERLVFDISNVSDMYDINKFISTDTGTYIVLETISPEINLDLIYNDNLYQADKRLLALEGDKYIFILQYNLGKDDINNDTLQIKDSMGNSLKPY